MRREVASLAVGLGTGAAAGMIGVGGGEFRIPALVRLVGGCMASVASVNLLIGLLTVSASLLLRSLAGLAGGEAILYGAYLSLGSAPGAYLGAAAAGRVPDRALRAAVAAYLLVVGLRLLLEPLVGEVHEALRVEGALAPPLLALLGLAVGAVSAMFGVAGGELRIPALMMLFGMGVREAGTASLVASIATVGVGLAGHALAGRLEAGSGRVAWPMAAGSSLGIAAGVSLASQVHEGHLRLALGAILVLATVRFVVEWPQGPRREEARNQAPKPARAAEQRADAARRPRSDRRSPSLEAARETSENQARSQDQWAAARSGRASGPRGAALDISEAPTVAHHRKKCGFPAVVATPARRGPPRGGLGRRPPLAASPAAAM
ncbi:MAG: sulfite exporter TauE/SafE family protein [Candidatus Nezhaarchaeales archaeon]